MQIDRVLGARLLTPEKALWWDVLQDHDRMGRRLPPSRHRNDGMQMESWQEEGAQSASSHFHHDEAWHQHGWLTLREAKARSIKEEKHGLGDRVVWVEATGTRDGIANDEVRFDQGQPWCGIDAIGHADANWYHDSEITWQSCIKVPLESIKFKALVTITAKCNPRGTRSDRKISSAIGREHSTSS